MLNHTPDVRHEYRWPEYGGRFVFFLLRAVRDSGKHCTGGNGLS